MTRHIGLDAHSESCTIVVMGPTGKRLKEEVLETNIAAIKQFIRTIPKPRHLCLEEGTLSEWLYEELEPLLDRIVVVMPTKDAGSKTDSIDAWKRADELRRDAITRPVFKDPGRFRGLREATRTHCVMQRDKVRSKTRIHALCRGCGKVELVKALYEPETRSVALESLPEHYRSRAELYGKQLDGLTKCTIAAETWLREEAKKVPIVARLATAPGIGIIRASYIVSIVISPHRFRTSRQFWSYCGLAVVMHSSSDYIRQLDGSWQRTKTQQTRGLNQNHHPLLKNVFKGAAIHVTKMKDNPLGLAYAKQLAETKPNLARLTIARRVAACVLAMWKSGTDYDPNYEPEIKKGNASKQANEPK
jgi:transposase